MKPSLDTRLLLDRYGYDRATGRIFRRRRHGPFKAGSLVGSLTSHGRLRMKINNHIYQVHRIVWQIVTGAEPIGDIDHINGDPIDNRFENLRLCNNSQNQANRRQTARNTSGFKGVTWHKKCCKWQAQIKVRGKSHHLGLFDDPEAAHAAYLAAARIHFGQFARAA